MSHLEPKPEDNKDILAAKAALNSDARVILPEVVRLLERVLDERSDLIAKLAEASDSMIDVAAAFQAHTELQQESLSWQRGLIKEIAAIMEPDDSDPGPLPFPPEDYVVQPVIDLMERGK